MGRNYYLLCVGDNFNKVVCDNVNTRYIEEKELDEYDSIYLKKIRLDMVTENRYSFFKRTYSVDVQKLVDVPIYVEKFTDSLQDVVTGTVFPIIPRDEKEKVLFHGCYPSSERSVVEFLKSLKDDDIKRYKEAMVEFKEAILKANTDIIDSMNADDDYIRQFKKKYR